MATKTKSTPKTNTLTKNNAQTKRAERAKTKPETIVKDEFVLDTPDSTTPIALNFTPYGKGLLRRAIENVKDNTGDAIEDETGRLDVKNRSELLKATNGDLAASITAITEIGLTAKEQASLIYSLSYAVMKAALFIANLDYRRWLDPRDGIAPPIGVDQKWQALRPTEDSAFAADQREETREAPAGLGADPEPDAWAFDTICFEALRDINAHLGAMCEVFGWQSDNGMPFLTIRDDQTGNYHSYYDVEAALDELERSRQIRLTKMREKRTRDMGKAAAKAREIMLAATRAALATA